VKLWIELLAGPVAWFISLCLSFALAPWTCSLGSKPALFAIQALALLIAATSGWLAWKEWRQVGREFPGEAAGSVAATRAMASAGALLNATFFVVILAQIAAPALLGACE
jgi:hypothetical protein